eukprot:CAMPEP_0183751618 /NCGR_PEP_ID=MMETSP0739-20130205/1847_1 /TAXON_ID=385413 /ORGANISM="Thalassiosira miniscula, Strain CCMP1093" /LENGTH=75 /DNA_ID=CAMNT_0025987867 /DNA_START=17 /DNA_END=244 /DNA_ORIENTATION=-
MNMMMQDPQHPYGDGVSHMGGMAPGQYPGEQNQKQYWENQGRAPEDQQAEMALQSRLQEWKQKRESAKWMPAGHH